MQNSWAWAYGYLIINSSSFALKLIIIIHYSMHLSSNIFPCTTFSFFIGTCNTKISSKLEQLPSQKTTVVIRIYHEIAQHHYDFPLRWPHVTMVRSTAALALNPLQLLHWNCGTDFPETISLEFQLQGFDRWYLVPKSKTSLKIGI